MSLVIKENCWKWDSPKGSFFMKYYEDIFLAQKVKMIHQKLQSIDFPYHLSVEKNEDTHILKQRWFEGKSADYRQLEHQKKTLKALQALHETDNQLKWAEMQILPHYELREKWYRRFERFLENEYALKELLRENYQKIVTLASNALVSMDYNHHPFETRTLLHGDVVHHNFMIGEYSIKIVDFDLATLGQPSDELILWLHRVLPYVSYDLTYLMKVHPYLQEATHKLHYLRFPNEVMREALFYLKCNPRQQQACNPFIQSIVSEAIHYQNKLSNAIETLQ